MPELRNVIVFRVDGARYAVELRWIREVVTLGFVTTVPTAPGAITGVFNLHGAILPVLDLGALLGGAPGAAARQGDAALVLETEDAACALRVDQIDHVASLYETAGAIADVAGRALTLLDPTALIRRAIELVTEAGRAA